MKKEYFKPEIRFVAMSKSPFMAESPVQVGGPPDGGGTSEHGEYGDGLENGSRFGFWDDFDEDLLEDVEDINDLN